MSYQNNQSRPYYESLEDRAKQSAALRRLATSWDVKIIETSPGSPWDGFLYRENSLAALVEFKARDIKNMSTIPHIFLSAKKYDITMSRAYDSDIKFYFMVEDADGSLWIADLTNTELAVHKDSGRTKRTRDARDIEPCVHIPRSYFRRVE